VKALGLTNTQFLIAVIFGLLIAFVNVAATAPHPAEVPIQVITPVPTPPPVVIGSSAPAPVATADEEIPWWLRVMAAILMILLVGAAVYVAVFDIGQVADIDDNPFNTKMTNTVNMMTSMCMFSMIFIVVGLVVYFIIRGAGSPQ
jgi:hypothetical protein